MRKQTETFSGQCLTIHLHVGGLRPSESDQEDSLRVAHELDELLIEGRDAVEAEFIGAVEAVEPASRNVQIILACPDVDRLVEFIHPWLSSIDWPRAVKIDKQYGNRFDLHAKKGREKVK